MDTLKNLTSSIKNWWILLLLGIAYMVLGLWAMITPYSAYLSMSLLFSVIMLITGSIEIIFSVSNRKKLNGWGWYMAAGIFSMLVGILILRHPAITAVIFSVFVGFLLMFAGIRGISTAIEQKDNKAANWGWPLAFGILAIICSFLIIGDISFGTISIIVLTALALLSVGAFYITLSFRIKNQGR